MNIIAYIFSINSENDSRFYVRASDGQLTIERIYSINGTLNQAELYAVQFVALCHKKPSQITIVTDSYYIDSAFSREMGNWKKETEWDSELLKQTRILLGKINFKIKIDEQEINKIRSTIVC